MTQFLVYDVFTDTPFGGNQLGVIPDATGLSTKDMQNIAREFNYPESTFVLPPKDPKNSAHVRIFMPSKEIPFAGHPIIGTAVALNDLGYGDDLTFELGVGPIGVKVSGGAAAFTTHVPLEIIARPDIKIAANCLGLSPADIVQPPVMASVGLPFVLIELTDRAALSRANPIAEQHKIGAKMYPSKLGFAVLAYVRDDTEIHARMFAPSDGIPEDPATGSAAAALGSYLSQIEQKSLEITIHQGVDMGRPSVIKVVTQIKDGKTSTITVSGNAVRTMDGRLTI